MPDGTYIPLVGVTTLTPVESQYRTSVVIGEYDGFSDPPDRPWNLAATVNAVIGAGVVHSLYADVDPASLEELSTTGTTTAYLAPTQYLPLTLPLRFVAPPKVVDRIDDAVRPIVDAGYSRNDKPGDTSPYLSHGKIVTSPQAPSARTTTETRTMVTRPDRPLHCGRFPVSGQSVVRIRANARSSVARNVVTVRNIGRRPRRVRPSRSAES